MQPVVEIAGQSLDNRKVKNSRNKECMAAFIGRAHAGRRVSVLYRAGPCRVVQQGRAALVHHATGAQQGHQHTRRRAGHETRGAHARRRRAHRCRQAVPRACADHLRRLQGHDGCPVRAEPERGRKCRERFCRPGHLRLGLHDRHARGDGTLSRDARQRGAARGELQGHQKAARQMQRVRRVRDRDIQPDAREHCKGPLAGLLPAVRDHDRRRVARGFRSGRSRPDRACGAFGHAARAQFV